MSTQEVGMDSFKDIGEQAPFELVPGGWPDDSPARSALFDVAPEGFCGANYEDLFSLFKRTSVAHLMSPVALARQLIAPLAVPPGRKWLQRGDGRYFALMNGNGVVAAHWSNALERLLLRNDLHLRTLLPLRRLLPSWNLLSAGELYCPECYREDEGANRPRYHRLLWCIRCVQACPLHGTLLRKVPEHERAQYLRDCRLPGVSQQTGGSLASKTTTAAPLHKIETAKLVAELLDDVLHASVIFESNSLVSRFLGYAAECIDGGLVARQAKRLDMPEGRVLAWMAGTARPSLSELLRIARVFECSITDVLFGNKFILKAQSVASHQTPEPNNKRVVLVELEHVSTKILEMLQTQECTDVTAAAESLGFSKYQLRDAAPDAYATLVEHCAEAQARLDLESSELRFSEFLRSFMRLQQNGEYPTRAKVAADVFERTGIVIAYYDNFLARAHALSPVAARRGKPPLAANSTSPGNPPTKRSPEEFAQEVRELIRAGTCKDVRTAAEILGVSMAALRTLIPEAYSEMARHFAEVQRLDREERSEQRFSEFHKSFVSVQSRGLYPSRERVARDVFERTGLVIRQHDEFLWRAHQLSPPAKPRGRLPVANLVKVKPGRHRRKNSG
ncbi:hypothetical protein AWB80_01342 [Caballeronia pedi]|uniref:HTH cro/C1-type domain-containing protein n=1 Tax=Caballeronia pedi TaxID=1777141 RepID=A0A157ZVA7_9BURK|nr:TniQ family protein [Caballeronia pedi]SAK49396.1 hypothetical protein AWB80_01342 [Caballeronia pedi]